MSTTVFHEEEYVGDILAHLQSHERRSPPDPDMISRQPELDWTMRAYLLDTLVASQMRLELRAETLFLSISILDRYCSKRIVFKRHCGLVCMACLWIAAKYCEAKQHVPSMCALLRRGRGSPKRDGTSNNNIDIQRLLQMEIHILSTLEWNVGFPTVDAFLDVFILNGVADEELSSSNSNVKDMLPIIRHLALYLAENAMYHHEMISFGPFVISTCAMQLALFFLYSKQPSISTTATAIQEPAIPDSTFQACLYLMWDLSMSPTETVGAKYLKAEYSEVFFYILQYRYEMGLQTSSTSTPRKDNDESRRQLEYPTPPPTDEEDNSTHHYMIMTVKTMQEGGYEELQDDSDDDEEMNDLELS